MAKYEFNFGRDGVAQFDGEAKAWVIMPSKDLKEGHEVNMFGGWLLHNLRRPYPERVKAIIPARDCRAGYQLWNKGANYVMINEVNEVPVRRPIIGYNVTLEHASKPLYVPIASKVRFRTVASAVQTGDFINIMGWVASLHPIVNDDKYILIKFNDDTARHFRRNEAIIVSQAPVNRLEERDYLEVGETYLKILGINRVYEAPKPRVFENVDVTISTPGQPDKQWHAKRVEVTL